MQDMKQGDGEDVNRRKVRKKQFPVKKINSDGKDVSTMTYPHHYDVTLPRDYDLNNGSSNEEIYGEVAHRNIEEQYNIIYRGLPNFERPDSSSSQDHNQISTIDSISCTNEEQNKEDFNGTNNYFSENGLQIVPKSLDYKLKNKRHRHVYHTIELQGEGKTEVSKASHDKSPPPLPYKPHYLRPNYSGNVAPPIPPRIINREAMLQRRQLNEEYFENIRRSVDFDYVDVLDNEAASTLLEGEAFIGVNSSENIHLSTSGNDSHWMTEHENMGASFSEGSSFRSINQLTSNNVHCSASSENVDKPSTSSLQLNLPQNNATNWNYDLIHSLKILKQCGWYWGNMSWEEAEMMLDQKPGKVGLFLVRDSQDPLHILTVTARTAEHTIRHIRVEHADGKFQLYDPDRSMNRGAADCVRHPNIVTFIKLAMKHSRTGNFLYFVRPRNMGEPPVQIQLLSPISRFSCVKSLKYHARFTLRDVVPLESVAHLPVPTKLKEYLLKSQYFDVDEDLLCALAS